MRSVTVNIQHCKYPLLTACIRENKWETTELQSDECNLFWSDKSVTLQRVLELEPHQCINHFPGIKALSRKAQLAHHLKRMKHAFPHEYDFVPQTWVLPKDWSAFERTVRSQKCRNRTYIVKPDDGSQGKGIVLTRNTASIDPKHLQVIQRYIASPFLIDGYKFDMRLYVLVRSIDPLRIYIYTDGLVRLCTEKYVKPLRSNLHATTMHLTNYAVNKKSKTFVPNSSAKETGTGSKRSVQWMLQWLETNKLDAIGTWQSIKDCIVKTIVSAQPAIAQVYNSCRLEQGRSQCFELLGFDILLDSKLKPWLIEVNHSPSFTASSPLDAQIKRNLLSNTLKMLSLDAKDKRELQKSRRSQAKSRLYGNPKNIRVTENSTVRREQRIENVEAKHIGNFERAFPSSSPSDAKYTELLNGSRQLHSHGTNSCKKVPRMLNLNSLDMY